MRILLVTPALNAPNGLSRNVAWLTEALLKAGNAVAFAALAAKGTPAYPVPAGAEVCPLRAGRSGGYVESLARLIHERQPGALIAFGHALNVSAIRARRAAKAAIPLAVTTTEVLSLYLGARPKMLSQVTRQIQRWYPEADAVVALSSGVAEDLTRTTGLGAERLRVIPNAVDCEAVRRLAPEEPDHPWFRGEGPPLVLGVGRLIPQKRYGLLLRNFAKVRARREARLIVLGDGPMRRPLEKLVGKLRLDDAVRLPGHTSNPFACMARAAAFAHVSRWESFGSVLVEALACGTPVVAVDCPGAPRDILGRGRYGRLVPEGDEPALQRALLEALEARPDRDALRRRADDFAAPLIAGQWLSLLRGLGASDTGP